MCRGLHKFGLPYIPRCSSLAFWEGAQLDQGNDKLFHSININGSDRTLARAMSRSWTDESGFAVNLVCMSGQVR